MMALQMSRIFASRQTSGFKAEVSDGERWRAAEVSATIRRGFQIQTLSARRTPADRLIVEGVEYGI